MMTTKPTNLKATSKQYKTALDHWGLTIVGAAPYLGISRRQSQRIAAGHAAPPKTVAKLMKVMLVHKIDVEELAE